MKLPTTPIREYAMTLLQLEYIVALDTYRHFATAAERCFVTQPTLSMQIQKLEEELGVAIFNRSKVPVVPTAVGEEILRQARIVLSSAAGIREIVSVAKNSIEGDLRLGVIPTVAPYLLPLFLQSFIQKYPLVHLKIKELTTDVLVERLKAGKIDAGIVVTPLNEASLKEHVLYYEQFVAYVSAKNTLHKKQYLLPGDLNVQQLWLLEEGHCFRSQILNLCELRKASPGWDSFEYEAGSIETLKKMVEAGNGITILPELALADLSARQTKMLRYFKAPVPVREVSLVTRNDFAKKKIIEVLAAAISDALPAQIRQQRAAASTTTVVHFDEA